jgi:type II secretory pathway pseudopilin PulG
MRSLRDTVTRAFTLVEIAVSMTIFALLAIALLGLIKGSADTSDVVSAMTRVQLDAERVMRQVVDELRLTGVQGGGEFSLDHSPAGAGVVWEMRYHRLDPRQPIFNAGTPSSPPWSTEWFILRCEEAEAVDGVDNDGDFLIDEQRVVLYMDDGTERKISVFGDNLTSFEAGDPAEPPPGVEAAGLVRPRLRLRLTVDWLLRSAVTDPSQIQDNRNPQKNLSRSPWTRYVSDTEFTFSS